MSLYRTVAGQVPSGLHQCVAQDLSNAMKHSRLCHSCLGNKMHWCCQWLCALDQSQICTSPGLLHCACPLMTLLRQNFFDPRLACCRSGIESEMVHTSPDTWLLLGLIPNIFNK